jgi:flavin reductase (DIM6/NTAB) family NADH-FMN oxidoreductase RutF
MSKKIIDVSGALFPTPVVLVTTISNNGQANIITLAWVGVVCSTPFMVGISIRPQRYSHLLISEIPEVVINLPGKDLIEKTDYCGTVSGRQVDKFSSTNFTPLPAKHVRPPLIKECPVNLEAKVERTTSLGAHDHYFCRVLAVHADKNVTDGRRINYQLIKPFVYLQNDYLELGKNIGYYAYTKKKSNS